MFRYSLSVLLFIKTCLEHAMKKPTQMLQMMAALKFNKAFLAASAQYGISCALVIIKYILSSKVYYFLSAIGHILPAWTTKIHFAILPQIATYFASIMHVASRYRLCQFRGGSKARKRGVLFLCSQTTPISKPHPLIINTLY